jgi:hypothetical protein
MLKLNNIVWFSLWCLMPLSTIFQLYRGVSFIGGGKRSTQRKPLTCRHERGLYSQRYKIYKTLLLQTGRVPRQTSLKSSSVANSKNMYIYYKKSDN